MLLTTTRNWLTTQHLDAVLISSRQNKQPHLGISTASGYVLITREQAHIFVDPRYYNELASQCLGYQLHRLDAVNDLVSIVNILTQEENLRRIGFEGEQVSWEKGCYLRNALFAELASITLDEIRQVKTHDEIISIREACRIADQSCEYIRKFIQQGMREREVATELEWYMKSSGADNLSFDTIITSGKRGALPHGKATDKVIEAGELITLDFGARYNGYCSDITRTFLVAGKYAQSECHPLWNIYQIVFNAQQAAIDVICPGIACHAVDNAARQIIHRAGHGHHFGHNTGHAIGIEVHENPRFSPTDSTLLLPGMLLTVEPGIYLPDEGGVRIEDVVLVTESGCEVLYSMPKNLLMTGDN